MKIAGLVERLDHVCCRYRLAAYQDQWKAAGKQLDLFALPSGTLSRFMLFRQLSKYDVVIVQRCLLPVLQTKLLKSFVRCLVFDFDDAIWMRDSYHRKGMVSSKRLRRFKAMAAAADLVVAGNHFLAKFANEYSQQQSVIIPTTVDTNQYQATAHSVRPPRLVWVGSASTLTGMEKIRALLDTIGRTVPDATLKLICDQRLHLDHLKVDFVPWTKETEITEICDADIGIAHMPVDDWSRGKCGLKIVQYQAAGLPVIANRVGVHEEMVIPGETGFLADTPDEWISAVKMLTHSPSQRVTLGTNGRRLCEEKYDQKVAGRKWMAELQKLHISYRRAS